jgi:hypothetical protein
LFLCHDKNHVLCTHEQERRRSFCLVSLPLYSQTLPLRNKLQKTEFCIGAKTTTTTPMGASQCGLSIYL